MATDDALGRGHHDNDGQLTLAQRRAQARILTRIEIPLLLVAMAALTAGGLWPGNLVLLGLWLAVIPYVRVTQDFWCCSWTEVLVMVAATLAFYAGRGWLALLDQPGGLLGATGLRGALNGLLLGVGAVVLVVGYVLWQRARHLRASARQVSRAE